MVWEEQDCSQSFPKSPEEANLDLLNYLEQRDMWQRHQNLKVPKFCVGSIVAVTRADRCLLYTSPSPRDKRQSRMPSSA